MNFQTSFARDDIINHLTSLFFVRDIVSSTNVYPCEQPASNGVGG